jgi:hypothetical protein
MRALKTRTAANSRPKAQWYVWESPERDPIMIGVQCSWLKDSSCALAARRG